MENDQTRWSYEKLTLSRKAAVPATPAPSPIPIPIPVVSGSRILIWKQDPTVADTGIRGTYIPTLVLDGP